MTGAFQQNAYQNNAFQVDGSTVQPVSESDKGGLDQWVMVDRGPTLGMQMVRVLPQVRITAAGTFEIGPDTGVVLVSIDDFVNVILPNASDWLNQYPLQRQNDFGGGIMVKDLGGNAGTFNIAVYAQAVGQSVDGAAGFTLNQNFQCARFFPLNDLSGWVRG